MKKTTLLLTGTALALGATSAFAGSHTGSITAVSWGGAYTVSQVEAYISLGLRRPVTPLYQKTILAVLQR